MYTYEYPATEFAAAWLAVNNAVSTDDARPSLCAMNFERYGDGILLVATDSYCLLRSYVPLLGHDDIFNLDEKDVGEMPAEAWAVHDVDSRLKSLMTFAAKDARAAAKNCLEVSPVRIERVLVRPEGGLAGMDWPHVRVTYGTEQLDVPISDAPYPPWRGLVAGHVPAPTGHTVFGAALRTLSKVAGDSGFACVYSGSTGAVLVEVLGAVPPVRGIVMPIRDGRYDTAPKEPLPPDIEGQESLDVLMRPLR